MKQPLICSDPAFLGQLQALLWVGFIIMLVVFFYFWAKDNADAWKKTETTTKKGVYCPLHRTEREQCEDKHRDDS